MKRTIVLLLAGIGFLSYTVPAWSDEPQAQKAVLITGATTGIGRLTAETLIERYDFMDQARLVRRTTFGNGVTATVNGRPEVYETTSVLGGTVCLPPYGFLVESETFVAFHALSWGDVVYEEPVLFTLSSRDGRPLIGSEQVRVFHGFGDARLSWRGEVIEVVREQVVH